MKATSGPYEAVTAREMVYRLGSQCSPMSGKAGYVVGPDINGRICHLITCTTLAEARERADRLNKVTKETP